MIMKDKAILNRFLLVVGIMILFAILRVVIKLPNVSPVAAIALFGGTLIFRRSWAILLPLAILFLSDALIGFYSIYLMLFVYAAFALIAVLGFWLRNHLKFHNVIIASLASSVIFYLVSNFGVWIEGLWYPMTFTGLIECYTLALPFFRYEILGTLGFSILFFGIYQFSTSNIKAFKTA